MDRSPILFRCDANPQRGWEAFYQCLTYAAALQRRRRPAYFLGQVTPFPLLSQIVRGGNDYIPATHDVGTVEAGPVLYDLGDAADVLRWYREFMPAQPDELNGFFAFLSIPPGPPFPEELHLRPVCAVVWCHTGASDSPALREARSFGTPLVDGIAPVPLPASGPACRAGGLRARDRRSALLGRRQPSRSP